MEEKLHLLNTMPTTMTTTTTSNKNDMNNADKDDDIDVKERKGNAVHQNNSSINNNNNNNSMNGNRKRSRSDMTDATDATGDVLIDHDNNDSLDKRRSSDQQRFKDSQPKSDSNKNNKRPKLFELAQQRLSKWAARLFDPHRPRGLVETPAEIPLNDEFLQAFGRREKAMDAQLGKAPLSIDREIIDETDHEDNDDDDILLKPASKGLASKATTTATAESSNNRKSKVKITNIPFALTPSALKAVCAQFGLVTDCNLLMDDDCKTRNLGRAYVTFETADSAQACVDELHELEGRPLRITLAEDLKKNAPTSGRGNAAGGGGTGDRYWEEDITTKCFRCGQVGHIGAHCTNAPKVQPCPLCSKPDHDMRTCPVRVVCFNCGIPGHESRFCNQSQKRMPPRRICTVCFQSGHCKTQSHLCAAQSSTASSPRRSRGSYDNRSMNSSQSAICMACGEVGHYLCRDMKWFFGLQGVTCSNCGSVGHIGAHCQMPNLEACSRNEATAVEVIDSANNILTAEEEMVRRQEAELEEKRRKERQRERDAGASRLRNRMRDRSKGDRDKSNHHHHHHHRHRSQDAPWGRGHESARDPRRDDRSRHEQQQPRAQSLGPLRAKRNEPGQRGNLQKRFR